MKNALISAISGAIMGALVCALAIGIGPIPWLAGKIAGPADASQNALSSPTVGTVSGLQLTNNYNNALDSLNTCNSGTSAPTNQLSGVPSLGNCWINTTSNPYPVNIYDGAQWLASHYLDVSAHNIYNSVGGGTATVSSATTTNICSVPQYFITISGVTTITSFGSSGCAIGQEKKITFSGILTLTYNATSLIIPGAANIVTAAGDTAAVIYLGSGNWQVLVYQPASGQAILNPAIEVGAVQWTFSANLPGSGKYLYGYGQAVSRSTYAALMTAYTVVQSVTATIGSPTLTGFSDTTQLCQNTAVFEASFLPANATIISCTSSTVTLNKNATASTTGNVTVFLYGDGDGSTTFNMPDCRGMVMAGRDNMGGTNRGTLTSTYFVHNPDSLGATGGSQNFTLGTAHIPQFTFTPTISGDGSSVSVTNSAGTQFIADTGTHGNLVSSAGNGTQQASASFPVNNVAAHLTNSSTSIGQASPTPVVTLPPMLTANCMIRVLAMQQPLRAPEPVAANDNQFAAIEPRRNAA